MRRLLANRLLNSQIDREPEGEPIPVEGELGEDGRPKQT